MKTRFIIFIICLASLALSAYSQGYLGVNFGGDYDLIEEEYIMNPVISSLLGYDYYRSKL